MLRPTPNNREIKLNTKRYIISKTDIKGKIEYSNDYFIEVSGYSMEELLGQAHSIVRHPDMPKVIFKMMWERISQGKNIVAIVKNLAKDGRFYWVTTEFEPKRDDITNEIISHTAFRKIVPEKALEIIQPLYKKLLQIEETSSVMESEMYFRSFLVDNNTTYDELIDSLINEKNLFTGLFSGVKNIFS